MLCLQHKKRTCAFTTDGPKQIKVGIGDFEVENYLIAYAAFWHQIGEKR